MDEIIINLQPVYNYSTNSVEFSEVLIRAYKGIKGPKNIIDYIFNNNIYKQFDLDVLKKAYTLTQEFDSVLSVNLTHKTIEDETLIDDIINILGNNRESIIFEINEETDFNNIIVKQNLIRLKELGFKLALDDFGVGNTSIEVLRDNHFDIIKIDKEFKDDTSELIKLKKYMRDKEHTYIIEGVEDTDKLKEMISLGYYIIQGYVFTEPLCTNDFRRITNGKH